MNKEKILLTSLLSLFLVACSGNSNSSSSYVNLNSSHVNSSSTYVDSSSTYVDSSSTSIQAVLTKQDYYEAFNAVFKKMENDVFASQSETNNLQKKGRQSYFGFDINDADLIEDTSTLGMLNALVFDYFFVIVLNKSNFELTNEFVTYSAEVANTPTGVLQFKHDENSLYGSMYMQPEGTPQPGLFTISINYDYDSAKIDSFEWLLRAVGGTNSMYHYYDGVKGYTISNTSDSMTAVESYLDDCLKDYVTPTDNIDYILVEEWAEVTRYANEGPK